MTDLSPLMARLRGEESLRLQAYDDATGKMIRPGSRVMGNVTIGIGINLGPGAGITEAEAEYLLQNRLRTAAADAATLPGFNGLDDVRRLVLIDMVFNMGAPTVRKFAGMLDAIQNHTYAAAAAAMLDSLWARQTGARAQALAEIMRTGGWQ